MNRAAFEMGFRDWLAEKTGKQVGLVNVPSVKPTVPYFIVYPLPTGKISGSLGTPEMDEEAYLQVTCVGISYRQVADASDLVRKCVSGRNQNGEYEEALSLSGYDVLDRATHQIGAIQKSGDNLFQCADVYRITVGA